MGAHDAPEWLIAEWMRTLHGAGATADEGQVRATGQRLLERWSGPGRHYHNLRHLADVLARVDELSEETHEPDLVRLAAWYHGAIFTAEEKASYAHRGGEDEQASAALARVELGELGLRPEAVQRVAELVTALRRHQSRPEDFDCAVLCDADLAVLAGDPQRYRSYLADVRAEYSHLPVEEFVRARIAILRKLDGRRRLFSSPLGAAWEGPARQNLEAELHRLEKELAKIEAEHARATGDEGAVGPAAPTNGQAAADPADSRADRA